MLTIEKVEEIKAECVRAKKLAEDSMCHKNAAWYGDLIHLADLAREALSRKGEWIPVAERLPEVPVGNALYFWITCRRASGKSYAFPAVYANANPLCCEEPREASGPGWSQSVSPEKDEDYNDSIRVTGWYDIKSEDSEYDERWDPVCSKGDEVTAWMERPAPYQSPTPPEE